VLPTLLPTYHFQKAHWTQPGNIQSSKSANYNVAQSKHNNIFNNVKLLHAAVTSNHHQADILVH
jgi:hypothetical protein